MNYNWNWHILLEQAPDGTGSYLHSLFIGLLWTLSIALLAWLIALVLGTFIGVIRTHPNKALMAAGNAYAELFRNIPLIVQMFLWYFVVPEFLPVDLGDWIKALPNNAFYTAVICLGFFTSARVAVQLSAGINSLSRGQRMAGLALGMTQGQTYRHVLLPMAFRIVVPPLTSEFLGVIKNSAVALTIGVMELTAQTRSMQEFTFQVFEAFTVATVLYIIVNVIVVNLMRKLENRMAVPGYISSAK
ncbi:amine acid ABC transporter, permease protein, 3-TM region, His/Glu/Gln/Arg/opine family [Herbaspirillum sp. CF444]|uniref:amino acid ABC transporter permease n=1 Tax=Herbaspirillum sp. CF444 TaxID=1144319 RepID=UPI0002723A15|nr:amino acid ABC transporter permease [Herbaspirillum sp. CF444]EJL88255.1 amine acid ABC transporter, permease protein, 3-TM region, His/Glu/Gln/Arg/opine family [Herbaspirillum sp. CF444]